MYTERTVSKKCWRISIGDAADPGYEFRLDRCFQERHQRLPPELQKQLREVLGNLLENPVPASVRLEKLAGNDLYTIHGTRNHSHKLSFELEGSTAILRRVRTHKEIDRAP